MFKIPSFEFDLLWCKRHDIWNIVWLPIVFGLNANFLLQWNLYNETLFVWVFVTYLILDLFWILIKPCSVSAPITIVLHHLVTISGALLIPYTTETVKTAICMASMVELNTWFRMLKKIFKQYETVLDVLFIISWILIRCIIGPYVQYILTLECFYCCTFANILLVLCGAFLNGLSVMWTAELLVVVRKRYFY